MQTYSRHEHIKRSCDFKQLFRHGSKAGIRGARLFYAANGLSYSRLGLSLPRGYGNAVQRNRAKRVSREAYRQMKDSIKSGYDIVLLVYPGGEDTTKERKQMLVALCRRAGLVREWQADGTLDVPHGGGAVLPCEQKRGGRL